MNFVFVDTCSWIDFARGQTSPKAAYDYSDENRIILDKLIELKRTGKIILLKNEIIDEEFKDASVDDLIKNYKENILDKLEDMLSNGVLKNTDDNRLRSSINHILRNKEDFEPSFRDKNEEFNKRVISLFNTLDYINVSENLKQKALNYAIKKNHPLFANRKNNLNDYLILYSIQEWIETNPILRNLDETSQDHVVYFLTRNLPDFGIKGDTFQDNLNISQLIKPVRNFRHLLSMINLRISNAEDLILEKSELNENKRLIEEGSLDQAINILTRVAELKSEFLRVYIREKISLFQKKTRLKYVSEILESRVVSYEFGDFPIVRSQNITNGVIDFSNLMKINFENCRTTTCYNDVLIKSTGKDIGEHVLNEHHQMAAVHPSLMVVRCISNKLSPKYLDYFLQANPINRTAYSGGVWSSLSIKSLREIELILPDINEQNQLVNLFRNKEAEIDLDIQQIKRKIYLLLQ